MKDFKIKKICVGAGFSQRHWAGECIDIKYTFGRNKGRIAYMHNDPDVYIIFIYKGKGDNNAAGEKDNHGDAAKLAAIH